jgi:hypothetical protein
MSYQGKQENRSSWNFLFNTLKKREGIEKMGRREVRLHIKGGWQESLILRF